MRRSFIVCLHDVSPKFSAELEVIFSAITPLVGSVLSAAIVPNWRGLYPLDEHGAWAASVRSRSDEILLHGYFHGRQRGLSPVSCLTARADEMSRLSEAAICELISKGISDVERALDISPVGFVAPAWQRGRLTPVYARECGLRFLVGYFSVWHLQQSVTRLPITTWSWDCGNFWALGWCGELSGIISSGFAPESTPVIVLHPRDVARGFLRRATRRIAMLLETGATPSTFFREGQRRAMAR